MKAKLVFNTLLTLMLITARPAAAQTFHNPCDFESELTAVWKQAELDWPTWMPGVVGKPLADISGNRVFFIGNNGTVYNYYWDNNADWEFQQLSAGQFTFINPAGGLYQDQTGRVFGIGTDNKAYNFYWHNNAWQFNALNPSQYALLDPAGGLLVSDIDGKVYGIGADGKVYNYYWSNNAWQFNALTAGQYTNIDPRGGLVQDQTGKIFAIGVDGKVYNFYWTGSSWAFNWLVPNQYATIDARGKLLIDSSGKIYGVGTDGKVYNYYWTGSSWAFNWLHPSPYGSIDARAGLVMDQTGKIFGIGTDGKVYNYYWNGSSWSFGWLHSNPAALANAVGGIETDLGKIYFIGTDGKAYNYYWAGNAWQLQSLYAWQSVPLGATPGLTIAGHEQVYAVNALTGELNVFYYANTPLNYCDWNLAAAYEFGNTTTMKSVSGSWLTNGYSWGHTNNLGYQWEYNDAGALSLTSNCLRITANNSPVWGYVDDNLPANHIMSDGQQNYRQFAFTSGVITSKTSYTYGLFEIRCQQPAGRGFWPAFWLIGANSWPPEIDVFEGKGSKPLYSSNNVHWPGESCSMGYELNSGTDFTQGFHTFSMAWHPNRITFYLDGEEVRTLYHHVPQTPMNIIANLAVGLEYPDGSTPFPAHFDIDYIRIYTYGPHCREAAEPEAPETQMPEPRTSFQVYPNPAAGTLSICAVDETQQLEKVELYNIEGQKLLEQDQLASPYLNLDVEALPPGIYVVRIYSAGGVLSKKIVKQ